MSIMYISATLVYMEIVKDFIVNNWQYISVGLVILLELILLILKKKIAVVDDTCYQHIVSLIKLAEANLTNVDGSVKKDFVIKTFFKEHPELDPSIYSPYVVSTIEEILETPTKKGGFGRGKK